MLIFSKLKNVASFMTMLLTLKVLAGSTSAQAQEAAKQLSQEDTDLATVTKLAHAPPEISTLTEEQRLALQNMIDRAVVRESLAHATESEVVQE